MVSSALILLAAALTMSALLAQTPSPPKAQWPKKGEKHKTAIDAFTKALTLASHDSDFRKRLIKPDSAKIAVAEVGNIDIPDEDVIVFYENEATESSGLSSQSSVRATVSSGGETRMTVRTNDNGKTWVNVFRDIGRNEHYHIFCLPPFDKNSKQEQIYQKWQTGAYNVWWE